MSELSLSGVRSCLEGVVPAVVATAAADGTPNITYLSKVHFVDDEHIALSNQFFSKTTRNLAENPRASMLIVSPSYEQYRLTTRYERTERRGPIFEGLRRDLDAIAAITGMQDVFKLRAADVYRVIAIERYPTARSEELSTSRPTIDPVALGELAARLCRSHDLDALVGAALDGLAELFGYEHSLLLLRDEDGSRMYTIASHGYDSAGVGSEIVVGEGVVGMAAARCAPMRVGNLGQMRKYSRTVRRAFEEHGAIEAGREIPLPAFPSAESQLAVPAMVHGQLVGVLAIESSVPAAFEVEDEALLGMVANQIASAIEIKFAYERAAEPVAPLDRGGAEPPPAIGPMTHVRYFSVDGSMFLANQYLIKGVAGRVLWSLLEHYTKEGRTEFTNREVRLDPTLELPDLRDNLESRLILLKRRLEERDAPIRLEKTSRGRFRLLVSGALRLEEVLASS
jgi:adenylate cyclase